MNVLCLLRGAAGCGKSTWLQANKLDQYAISADTIRLLIQSPVTALDGTSYISNANDKQTWELLFSLLRERMKRGEFTIIDATHARASFITKYRDLAKEYRYRVYVVDFSDIPIETILERNRNRDQYKYVPEDAIELMVTKINTQPAPGWVTSINHTEFFNYFPELTFYDNNSYNRIHHIGDVHGCATPLQSYLDQYYNPNDLFIFVGDYFDRGSENVGVFHIIQGLMDKPNVRFLRGNHEAHIWDYANDLPAVSKEFENYTKRDFDAVGVDKKVLRNFYTKLGQLAAYTYNGMYVLVTHGGVPVLPTIFTPAIELIKGVGRYEDMNAVVDTWNNRMRGDYFQVFGHRNVPLDPIRNGRTFNLCDRVEFGGNLRAVILDADGFHEVMIPNTVTPRESIVLDDATVETMTPDTQVSTFEMIAKLRSSKTVYEKKLGDGVSSFNFTRDTFYSRKYDAMALKARGLFLNVNTGSIVSRSYDKFFNIGEVSETNPEILRRKLKGPIDLYVKENGYLGLIGYNDETDKLFISTKTSNSGPLQDVFTKLLSDYMIDTDWLLYFVRNNNVSLVCEVVHPVEDPHIMTYSNPRVFLLDVIYRTWEYKKFPYQDVLTVANALNLDVKTHAYTFESGEEFISWYMSDVDQVYDYRFNGEPVEGFVIEDASGFMVKIKTKFYNTWKMLRTIKMKMVKRQPVDTAWFNDIISNQVYAYMRNLNVAVLGDVDIPTLRWMWENDYVA